MKQQRMKSQLNSSVNVQVFSGSPSLSEAIGQLPRQYVNVLCRPSVQTFREEMSNASWKLVVIQVCMLIILTVTLSSLAHLIPFSALHTTSAVGMGAFRPFAFLPSPFNGIAFILGSFVIGLSTAYLFSRLWGGQGSFLLHLHSLLLCTLPLVTISGALLLIPATGPLVVLLSTIVFLLFVYRLLLHVFIVMGVHSLSGIKAFCIVLIIPMSLVVIAMFALMIVAIVTHSEALDVSGDMILSSFESSGWCSKERNQSHLHSSELHERVEREG